MPENAHQAGEPAEIEVVGGYDQDLADHSVCRPIPEWDVEAVKRLTSREQVRQYLLALPDAFLIDTYRHIQYRYLADGSLWDVSGYARVDRRVAPAETIQPGSVRNLPEVSAESVADYARGWRPLPPPKVTDNPCEQCAGRGICPNCLGSGSA
jgi:hypothetical protein